MSETTALSGGSAGYRGYEYQRDVSVWVALSLLLADRGGAAASEMIIEPASAEDLEVSLDAPADGPSAGLHIEGSTKITIQVKFRDTGAWTAAEFRKLVEDRNTRGSRGPAPRVRAKSQLLREADRRYLLITSATVDPELAALRVAHVADVPDAAALPPGVAIDGAEEEALAGRFAIIPSKSPGWLHTEIRHLLVNHGHVPLGRVDGALDALRRAVKDRMLGLPVSLTRTHVQGILRGAGGLPHPDAELSEYREPRVAATARAILEAQHAVLLVGPPGYGKSLTARWLAYELRRAHPAFEVVDLSAGVSGIERALSEPGRHVFHLDDPWGNAGLAGDAQTWTVSLAKLIARATADKRFIITSRSDVFRGALGAAQEEPWRRIAIAINESTYTPELQWEILLGKVADDAGWREDLVRQHKARLLRNLTSPLALDRFAKALRRCPTPAAAHVGVLVDDAQVQSIRRVVAEQVKGWPGGIAPACIIWALLRGSRGVIRLSHLKRLQRKLEEDPAQLDVDLEAFVRHLEQGTLTRGADDTLTAHSKVIEALESVVTVHGSLARRMLSQAALALNALRVPDPSFASELIGLVDGVNAVAARGIELSPPARSAVDHFLLTRFLAADPSEVVPALNSLMNRASDMLPAVRFGRYLDRGAPVPPDEAGQWFGWRPPSLDPGEIAAIQRDVASARVAEVWVANVLADATEHYQSEALLEWLAPFGFRLDDAFMAACEGITRELRFQGNAGVIIEATLDRPDLPYGWVFRLIERWEQDIAAYAADVERGDPWQAELDFAYQLHLQDEYQTTGAIIPDAVESYVRARRRREGYDWIGAHPRPDLILPGWAKVMAHAEPQVTREELDAYFSLVASDGRLREEGLRIIGLRKVDEALNRLYEALRAGSRTERRASIDALGWFVEQIDVVDAILAAMKDLNEGEQIDLLLASAKLKVPEAADQSVVAAVTAAASDELRNAFEFAITLKRKAPADQVHAAFLRLAPEHVARLIESAPINIAGTLLSIAAHEGYDVADVAERWLEADDRDTVSAAIDALGRLGTPAGRARIVCVLDHRDYKLRQCAMRTLAPNASAEEKQFILALERDRESAEVLRELVSIIGEHGWDEGLPVLVRLLSNSRNYARHPEYGYEAPYQFRVARDAAEALVRLAPLPESDVEEIFDFVQKRDAASRDVEVHARLCDLLAAVPDPRMPPFLTSLLSDPRVVALREENLYPVRYAAAWALAKNVGSVISQEQIDWGEIARGARHYDPQLAAPCLCLLGTRLEATTHLEPEILDALRALEMTEPRRALALLVMDAAADAREVAARYEVLPLGHPLLALGKDASSNSSAEQEVGWRAHPQMEAWLRGLQVARDVEGVLMRVAEKRMKLDLETSGFDPYALRSKQPAVPMTSFSEMFGME